MTRTVLFALVCACVGTAVAERRPDWVLYRINDKAADYRLESIDRSAFRLSATRRDAPGKTMALAITDVNRSTWTHDKIVFSARSLDGRAVRMNVAVSYADGAKTPMKSVPDVVVSGRNWTDQVLSLDNDFGLGDRAVQIRQVKILLNPTDFPVGASGGRSPRSRSPFQFAKVSIAVAISVLCRTPSQNSRSSLLTLFALPSLQFVSICISFRF